MLFREVQWQTAVFADMQTMLFLCMQPAILVGANHVRPQVCPCHPSMHHVQGSRGLVSVRMAHRGQLRDVVRHMASQAFKCCASILLVALKPHNSNDGPRNKSNPERETLHEAAGSQEESQTSNACKILVHSRHVLEPHKQDPGMYFLVKCGIM